jgi:hypothetical protein
MGETGVKPNFQVANYILHLQALRRVGRSGCFYDGIEKGRSDVLDVSRDCKGRVCPPHLVSLPSPQIRLQDLDCPLLVCSRHPVNKPVASFAEAFMYGPTLELLSFPIAFRHRIALSTVEVLIHADSMRDDSRCEE